MTSRERPGRINPLSQREWTVIKDEQARLARVRAEWLEAGSHALPLENLTSRPKAVIFDVMSTLVDVRGLANSLKSLALALGTPESELIKVRRTYTDAFEIGMIGEKERAAFILSDLGLRIPATDYVRLEADALAATIKPFPGALTLLKDLRHRGYQTAICSNASMLGRRVMEHHGLPELFDATAYSSDLKTAKPMTPMFEAARAILGVAASDVLYIDDGADCSLEGAMREGFKAVRVDNPGGYSALHEHKVASDYQIQTIAMLGDCLP